MLSLGDIDRMFDDLGELHLEYFSLGCFFPALFHSFLTIPHYFSEPSDHEEDVVLPPSPLLHIDDTEANQSDTAPSPIEQQERHSSEETQKACFYSNLTFAHMTLLG